MTESASSTRSRPDWIELFLEFTSGVPSPELFRLWAGLTTIAGVLERRVYVSSGVGPIYPNLFTLLVAPPGVGKTQIIKITDRLWRKTSQVIVAPDNMTKAALIDVLKRAERKIVKNPLELIEYNSLQIAADEFGVLMSAHDLEFLSVLNKLYDNPAQYVEERRMFKGEPIYINHPQINIIAGAQPGFLASVFPEEAWSMGFTSRLCMIYSSTPKKVSIFDKASSFEAHEEQLAEGLRAMLDLKGPMIWDQKAMDTIKAWEEGGRQPVPTHARLEHYNTRRILHIIKLMTISSISRNDSMRIEVQDFDRALEWLVQAEMTMPDVFRTMSQKNDAIILQELHFFAWGLYGKERKWIHKTLLVHFLTTKIPSDRIMRMLELAEAAGFLIRQGGSDDLYRPAPKEDIGRTPSA